MNIFAIGTKVGMKNRRYLIAAILTIAAIGLGLVFGILLERNIGVTLTDRLARRIGSANADVVSCKRSGSALNLTVDFAQISKEKQWNLAYYGIVCEAVRTELTSGPFYGGINTVDIVCMDKGKQVQTMKSGRVPPDTGNSFDSSGKKIVPAPFSSFQLQAPDGSQGDLVLSNGSSQKS